MADPPALMHATQVARPFHTPGWVYEEKYDGWRMLAVKEEGVARLISRNGRDHTKRFVDVVAALTKLRPKTFTLDDEVTVFDGELISRFEWLRHLNHGDLATPPMLMAFDLLQLGEKDYRKEPLSVRRRALEKLLKGQALILPARRLSPNGFAAWAEVLHRGWEGMVAKDPESHYVAGRTLMWLKVKQAKYREKERGFYKP
jgi:bifunctional non-homologous end joining protein LigD